MMENSGSGARWYVVHTYSGYENKVKTNLEKIIENRGIQDLITDVRVPTETVVTTNEKGEQKETEVKLFPSYVLVKMVMTDATWHVVRDITGSTGFVGPGSRPVPLSDAEVAALGVDLRVENIEFSLGDRVRITGASPMAGFEGTISEIFESERKATVMASVFGRETPVEIDISSIEKIKV